MAFERCVSVSLRHFLLITLLILITLALSSNYGVNGQEQVADKRSKSSQIADKGIVGATGLNSVPDGKRVTGRRPKLKKRTITTPVSSLSPLGSKPVKAEDFQPTAASLPKSEQQKSSGTDSNNRDEKGHLIGSVGRPYAKKDLTSLVTKTDDEQKDDTKDDKEVLPEKPSKTGGSSQGAESEKNQLRKKPATEDVSSASSFMTYFVIVAIIVIIAYLIFHNKKKLMAYIVEGRNTSRGRRQRPTSGPEYKPLKNAEEASGSRPEDA